MRRRRSGEACPTRSSRRSTSRSSPPSTGGRMLVTGLGVFCDGYDISSIGLVLTASAGDLPVAPTTCRPCRRWLSAVGAGRLDAGRADVRRAGAEGPQALLRRRRADPGRRGPRAGVHADAAAADRLPLRARHRRRRRLCALADHHGRARQPRRPRQGDRPRLRHHVADRRADGGAVQAAARTRSTYRRTLVWKLVLAGGAIPALGVMYFRRRMPESARFLAQGGRRQGRRRWPSMQEVGAAAAPPRHPPTRVRSARCSRCTPGTSSPPRCSGCSTTWWSTPRSCSGRTSSPGTCDIPASIFQIETELMFVIPRLGADVLVHDRPVGPKTAAGLGLPRRRGRARDIRDPALRSSPASPLLAFLVFGLFNIALTGPGLVSGAGIYRRRAGADAHPQRRPVDHRGRAGGSARRSAASCSRASTRTSASSASMCGPRRAVAAGRRSASQLLVPETSSRSLEEINLEHAPVAKAAA